MNSIKNLLVTASACLLSLAANSFGAWVGYPIPGESPSAQMQREDRLEQERKARWAAMHEAKVKHDEAMLRASLIASYTHIQDQDDIDDHPYKVLSGWQSAMRLLDAEVALKAKYEKEITTLTAHESSLPANEQSPENVLSRITTLRKYLTNINGLIVKYKAQAERIENNYYGITNAPNEIAAYTNELLQPQQQQSPQSNQTRMQAQTNLQVVSQIVSNFHARTTYKRGRYGRTEVFVCSDMASTVWNEVTTKRINAKIMIGSVDKDISLVSDSDHAWVLAEISPMNWVGLETTAGVVVTADENPRYYRGHAFSDSGQLKDYINLAKGCNEAEANYNNAVNTYNQWVKRFNVAQTMEDQLSLTSELVKAKGSVETREVDLNKVTAQLNNLLRWEN